MGEKLKAKVWCKTVGAKKEKQKFVRKKLTQFLENF